MIIIFGCAATALPAWRDDPRVTTAMAPNPARPSSIMAISRMRWIMSGLLAAARAFRRRRSPRRRAAARRGGCASARRARRAARARQERAACRRPAQGARQQVSQRQQPARQGNAQHETGDRAGGHHQRRGRQQLDITAADPAAKPAECGQQGHHCGTDQRRRQAACAEPQAEAGERKDERTMHWEWFGRRGRGSQRRAGPRDRPRAGCHAPSR